MANGDDANEGESGAGFVDTGVVSTCFARIEYNAATQQLAMTFAKDGRRYMIDGIEEIEVHRWINSGSPGGYFNSFVRGAY